MKAFLLRVMAWAEHAVVLLCLAAGAAALVVYVKGGLTQEKAVDALAVIRGAKNAVTVAEHERWLRLEGEARARTLVEREEQIGSGEANVGFMRKKAYWQGQFDRESEMLRVIDMMLVSREQALSRRSQDLDAKDAVLHARIDAEAKRSTDANLKKALQLYQGMEAEVVAQDFTRKWATGTVDEKVEIVNLLRRMAPRFASEIVNAIDDPDVRMAIMKQMRES
jgi:hypothetical protein